MVALGKVPARLAGDAGEAVRAVFGAAPHAGPALDRPEYAFNRDRRQYHAPAVLRRLAALRAGAGGAPVVGITDVDLFVPDADFVLADVDRAAGAAVLSVKRLGAPDPALLRRRAQVELVHGTGHLLGLSHCPDRRCAMFLSRDPADSDRKGPGLCASCRAALELA